MIRKARVLRFKGKGLVRRLIWKGASIFGPPFKESRLEEGKNEENI